MACKRLVSFHPFLFCLWMSKVFCCFDNRSFHRFLMKVVRFSLK
ncbi:hypothetical protein SynROS8604_01329 [Synechococcus sp. ROS8604]|nr:hypothetical protein SynROS8604_01329 [Synechococcus sp. ROS8604]